MLFINLEKRDSSDLFSQNSLGLDYFQQIVYEVPHDSFYGQYVDIALQIDGELVMPDNQCSMYSFACVYPNRTEHIYDWTEKESLYFNDIQQINDDKFIILHDQAKIKVCDFYFEENLEQGYCDWTE